MNHILLFTLLAALALGLGRIFLKLGSGFFHPMVALVALYATLFSAGVTLFLLNIGTIKQNFVFNKTGFLYLVITGLVLAVFDFLAILIFRNGGKVALFAPITGGGSVLVAVLVGFLFLGEKISILQFGGAMLTAIGVAMLLL
ncbi:EamA family transporter [Patescibacteria group bacterium]|nr:EamA family transporter [Patescibacteria group bacterium]